MYGKIKHKEYLESVFNLYRGVPIKVYSFFPCLQQSKKKKQKKPLTYGGDITIWSTTQRLTLHFNTTTFADVLQEFKAIKVRFKRLMITKKAIENILWTLG